MNPADISAFEQAVTNLASKAGAAAVQYGPQALSVAEGYLHAMALLYAMRDGVNLLFGIVLASVWIIVFKKTYPMWKMLPSWKESDYTSEKKGVILAAYIITGVVVFVMTLISIASAISDFLSPQTFFGLFAPKMAVLNYALSLAGH